MKKFLSIILFCILVSSLILLMLTQNNNKKLLQTEISSNCSAKSSRDFATERAHGIILRDRAIAVVRLEGENNFSPPGGHIESDETPAQALERELEEELSVSANSKLFKEYKTYCEVLGSTRTQRTYVYFVESWNGELQVRSKDEFKWVNYEYNLSRDADIELKTLLDYLKKDNLID